ncbi:MAG: hypothetical protein U0441_11095 [Polyangiaceae bacterium]
MRTSWPGAGALLSLGALFVIGCSADPGKIKPAAATVGVPVLSTAAPIASGSAASAAPEYVRADLRQRSADAIVPLSNGTFGVLIDGTRAIVSEAGTTFAIEVAERAFVHAAAVPARLARASSSWFLFQTPDALFASATFDGPLRPVASFPVPIRGFSFGPDAILVRTSGNERWRIDLATGARQAPAPLGLVDVAALDDGRAIAVTEAGGLSVSTNGGKSWRDARADLRGAPALPFVRSGDVWVLDRVGSEDRSLRLAESGALVEAEAPRPPDPSRGDLRVPDKSTIHFAILYGARSGPRSAIVGARGDVVRVDLVTGALTTLAAGVLPDDMNCQATEVPNDIAIVCRRPGSTSVVMTKVLSGKAPRVERTFPTDGPFYASDGGALLYGGPCPSEDGENGPTSGGAPASTAPPKDASLPTACARNEDGTWQQHVLDPKPADTGTGSSTTPSPAPAKYTAKDVRWVPRLGRPPIAILSSPDLAFYDPAWGEIRLWAVQPGEKGLLAALKRQALPWSEYGWIVRRRWGATPSGGVEVRLEDRFVEVAPNGAVTSTLFGYGPAAGVGKQAFARAYGGRAFQTLDRGRTWTEIAAPPSAGVPTFDVLECSALGCDLGPWLRVGWSVTPPRTTPPTKSVKPAPVLPTAPQIRLQCVANGKADQRVFNSKQKPPTDLGLGTKPLPAPARHDPTEWEEAWFPRSAVDVFSLMGPPTARIAPRALQYGYRIDLLPSEQDPSINQIFTLGPSSAASAFRPELAFVEPLVPAAPIRRVSYGLAAITKAAKGTGVTLEDLVIWSKLSPVALVPIMPSPPKGKAAASGDVLVTIPALPSGTLFVVGRGGASPRADVLFTRRTFTAQSAAWLANGDLVILGLDDKEGETPLRFASNRVSEIGPRAVESWYPPPNPDAVAINAKGDVAVLRTPSGFEPPTADDPALLILRGPRIVPLAPWSAAVSASDPSCAASPDDMYRATIQIASPWVYVGDHPLGNPTLSGMTARVRWSPTRLCIEALDVPEERRENAAFPDRDTEPVITATFAPDEAARNDIEPGLEYREKLSCALTR